MNTEKFKPEIGTGDLRNIKKEYLDRRGKIFESDKEKEQIEEIISPEQKSLAEIRYEFLLSLQNGRITDFVLKRLGWEDLKGDDFMWQEEKIYNIDFNLLKYAPQCFIEAIFSRGSDTSDNRSNKYSVWGRSAFYRKGELIKAEGNDVFSGGENFERSLENVERSGTGGHLVVYIPAVAPNEAMIMLKCQTDRLDDQLREKSKIFREAMRSVMPQKEENTQLLESTFPAIKELVDKRSPLSHELYIARIHNYLTGWSIDEGTIDGVIKSRQERLNKSTTHKPEDIKQLFKRDVRYARGAAYGGGAYFGSMLERAMELQGWRYTHMANGDPSSLTHRDFPGKIVLTGWRDHYSFYVED